jgi:hypothetical protein
MIGEVALHIEPNEVYRRPLDVLVVLFEMTHFRNWQRPNFQPLIGQTIHFLKPSEALTMPCADSTKALIPLVRKYLND